MDIGTQEEDHGDSGGTGARRVVAGGGSGLAGECSYGACDALPNGGCDANATCAHATNGTAICTCKSGFDGKGALCVKPEQLAASPLESLEPTPVPVDSGLELGTAFAVRSTGRVAGIRYYRPAGMTGSVTGHLWDGSGAMLATAVSYAVGNVYARTANNPDPARLALGQQIFSALPATILALALVGPRAFAPVPEHAPALLGLGVLANER